MTSLRFIMPTSVVHGLGSIARLPETLRSLGVQKPLIVTDPGIVAAGLAERITGILDGAGVPFALFSEVGHQATTAEVAAAGELGSREGCDGVIPLGGGSPLVAGKAAAVLLSNGGTIIQFEGMNTLKKPPAPTVAVPTTAGSGSEVSQFIPIIDEAQNRKFVIGGDTCFPNAAILDGELLDSLPPNQAALSGVDALTHAMEAFLSTEATPITDALALPAMETLMADLRTVVHTSDLEARQRCLIASSMANMACGNAKLGHVHTMVRGVNSIYPNVSYGVAIAVLLVPVMEFNLPGAIDRFREMARKFGFSGEGLSPRDHAACVPRALKELIRDIGLPRSFDREVVKPAEIPRMARVCTQGVYGTGITTGDVAPSTPVPGVNVTRATYGDIVGLYEQSMKEWDFAPGGQDHVGA